MAPVAIQITQDKSIKYTQFEWIYCDFFLSSHAACFSLFFHCHRHILFHLHFLSFLFFIFFFQFFPLFFFSFFDAMDVKSWTRAKHSHPTIPAVMIFNFDLQFLLFRRSSDKNHNLFIDNQRRIIPFHIHSLCSLFLWTGMLRYWRKGKKKIPVIIHLYQNVVIYLSLGWKAQTWAATKPMIKLYGYYIKKFHLKQSELIGFLFYTYRSFSISPLRFYELFANKQTNKQSNQTFGNFIEFIKLV